MKYLLITILFIFTFKLSYSQITPEDKFGAWYTLDVNHKIFNKISIKTGIQLRSFEVFDNINLLFYYTGFDYQLNKNTKLTLVYCYLDIDRSFLISGENHLYENRPYEQITYKCKLFKLPVYQRFRLEHRFLNFKNNHSLLNRFRYQLGAKININKTFFLNINNEVFANLKGEVFTENRFYTAIGMNISKNNSIQLGYLNHEINNQNLNRLQVGLYFKIDLRKN